MQYIDRQVFEIGLPGAHEVGSPAEMGGHGHTLARLARLGLRVPESFVLGTAICRDCLRQPERTRGALRDLLAELLRRLESATRLAFGGARRPLLVSVRADAPSALPGRMGTLTHVGLCDATLHGLIRLTGNPRLAWNAYRRLVQRFAAAVHGADAAPFRAACEAAVREAGVSHARELDFRRQAQLARESLAIFRELTGQPFPQEPMAQIEAAVAAAFGAGQRRFDAPPDGLGTAVTVQRMVFGNAGGSSGAGLAFSRDPASGDNRLQADFLFNRPGEDIASGRPRADDAGRLRTLLPEVWARLDALRGTLEGEFRDAQEFEFTVQDGELFLLQTRTGRRTPWAGLRIAVDQVDEGLIEPAEALARLDGIDLAQLERRHAGSHGERAVWAAIAQWRRAGANARAPLSGSASRCASLAATT